MPNSKKKLNSTPALPQPTPHYRRKQFIVARGFQYRVIWQLILVVISSILVSNVVTLAFLKIREWTDPSSQNLIYLTNSLSDTLEFSRIMDFLWRPMLASTLIGVLLVCLFGIFYSHRIAGPLFNLKRMLKQLGEGNFQLNMHIRKTDEFHDVEESFNQMMDNLRERLHELENEVLQTTKTNKTKVETLFKKFYRDTQDPM